MQFTAARQTCLTVTTDANWAEHAVATLLQLLLLTKHACQQCCSCYCSASHLHVASAAVSVQSACADILFTAHQTCLSALLTAPLDAARQVQLARHCMQALQDTAETPVSNPSCFACVEPDAESYAVPARIYSVGMTTLEAVRLYNQNSGVYILLNTCLSWSRPTVACCLLLLQLLYTVILMQQLPVMPKDESCMLSAASAAALHLKPDLTAARLLTCCCGCLCCGAQNHLQAHWKHTYLLAENELG
jgi:hypothetical protein